jgi:Na+-driven multidrug efflux pump
MDLKKGFGKVKWRLKETRFYGREIGRILLLGFPTVLGGWSLSFGAIVMQAKINLFPSVASAGGLIASTINQIVFLVATGFVATVGTFVGQNWGAKQYKRIRRGMGYITGVVMLSVLLITVAVVLFKQQICGLFSSDSEVLEMAYLRLENDLLHGTFLQPLASLFGMALSAMGFAVWPMITNFISVFINIVWALVIFQLNPTLEFLYLVFPVTAIFTGVADLVITLIILKKVMKKTQAGVSCVASI